MSENKDAYIRDLMEGISTEALIQELSTRALTSENLTLLQSLKQADRTEGINTTDSSARVETSSLAESFARVVKGSCIENYGSKGRAMSNEIIQSKILDADGGMFNNKLQLQPLYPQDQDGYTRLAIVPLSDPSFKNGLPEGISKQDMVLIFAWRGEKVDKYGRSGHFRSVVVMSNTDTAKFTEEIKKDPTLAYELLKKLNGGPIQMEDGSPMNIKPGKSIEILANQVIGPQQKEYIPIKPFPQNYKPN